MSPAAESSGWVVVLPVKGGPEAKTRLVSPGVIDGGALAIAFARDLLGAVLSASDVVKVIVVSSDAMSRDALAADGVTLEPDPGRGLNPAALAGIAAARAAQPDAGVLVMLADLPCVTAGDVNGVLLAAACHQRAFVRDSQGSGTTLVALSPGAPAVTFFGAGSAELHAAAGFVEVTLPEGSRIRLDIDTPEDLATAVRLGAGPHTRAVLAQGANP